MSKPNILLFEKTFLLVLLLGSIVGFWFFEFSLLLRILVIILSIFGLSSAFFFKTEKTNLQSPREFLILLILYLGILTLYNLLYGLNIPTALIMAAILILSSALTFCLFSLDNLSGLVARPIVNLFIVLMGLINLEIFLTLSFWPINPQAKSFIIVIFFYLTSSLFYLYAHDVLRLKRISGFLITSIVLLGFLVLITWLGVLK